MKQFLLSLIAFMAFNTKAFASHNNKVITNDNMSSVGRELLSSCLEVIQESREVNTDSISIDYSRGAINLNDGAERNTNLVGALSVIAKLKNTNILITVLAPTYNDRVISMGCSREEYK